MASRIVTRAVLGVYVACFAAGAFNHARDFLLHGPRPYRSAPPMLEAFWSALLPLDLGVCALLLAGRRRAGLALAATIMAVDVGANSHAARALGYDLGSALQLQTLFLGFVLGSLPFVWPPTRLGPPSPSA